MQKLNLKFEYSNICSACGTSRRREDLVFDPKTLKPYCYNIQHCNALHPNSYSKVMHRNGALVEMIGYKDAQAIYVESVIKNADPHIVDVMKLANKPTSLRLSSIELAEYVIRYRMDNNLESTTAAIQSIIRDHMLKLSKQTGEEDEDEGDVIPEPMETYQNEIGPYPEPEPEPEQEEEDDGMTTMISSDPDSRNPLEDF